MQSNIRLSRLHDYRTVSVCTLTDSGVTQFTSHSVSPVATTTATFSSGHGIIHSTAYVSSPSLGVSSTNCATSILSTPHYSMGVIVSTPPPPPPPPITYEEMDLSGEVISTQKIQLNTNEGLCLQRDSFHFTQHCIWTSTALKQLIPV